MARDEGTEGEGLALAFCSEISEVKLLRERERERERERGMAALVTIYNLCTDRKNDRGGEMFHCSILRVGYYFPLSVPHFVSRRETEKIEKNEKRRGRRLRR